MRASDNGQAVPYREVFVPVDNSQHSDWAIDRAIELCQKWNGRITGNHVYAARLHDIRPALHGRPTSTRTPTARSPKEHTVLGA